MKYYKILILILALSNAKVFAQYIQDNKKSENQEKEVFNLRLNSKYKYSLSNPKIIKIGHVAPLTGGISHLGKDNENGVSLAIEEINEKGLEINGKKIHLMLISEDDEGSSSKAVEAAKKLVDDKVVAVVGHLNSGASIPASAIYNRANIVQISPSSTNPQYTNQGFKSAYRLITPDSNQAPALANYATKTLRAKNIVIIDDATAYGKSLANDFEETMQANGANIITHEITTDKTKDFKDILSKIKAKNPDIIMYGGMDITGAILAKQSAELGLNAKIFGGDGLCTDNLSRLAGNAVSNVFCSESGLPIEKMAQGAAFSKKYKKHFNSEAQIYSPATYDAVYVIVDAMKRANSTASAKILEKMPETKLKGIIGNIEFDNKGDLKQGIVTIYNYINNKKTPIDTISIFSK